MSFYLLRDLALAEASLVGSSPVTRKGLIKNKLLLDPHQCHARSFKAKYGYLNKAVISCGHCICLKCCLWINMYTDIVVYDHRENVVDVIDTPSSKCV